MGFHINDVRDGVVEFPEPGARIYDTDWEYPDWGTVTWAYYPEFHVTWDTDGLKTAERVKY